MAYGECMETMGYEWTIGDVGLRKIGLYPPGIKHGLLENMATENGPFISDFPIKPSIYRYL